VIHRLAGLASGPICLLASLAAHASPLLPSPRAAGLARPSADGAPAEARAGAEGLRLPPGFQPMRDWELALAPTLVAAGFFMRFGVDRPAANWEGGVLLDDEIQEAVSVRSATYRDIAFPLGEVGFIPMMVYRLVDAFAVAGAGHGRWDIAFQMFMMDLEAYGVLATTLWGAQLGVRRTRPRKTFCLEDPTYGPAIGGCSPRGDARSFISGHFGSAVTGAALTCVHHSNLQLYGGAGDAAACGVGVVFAAITGAARLTTDAHYATDIALGLGLGLVSGWMIPELLHYRDAPEPGDRAAAPRVTVAPRLHPEGGGGLALVGRF
jgi:membrane-associated phospholipid phosphatase